MSARAQQQDPASRSPFPGILSVVVFLTAGLAMVTMYGQDSASLGDIEATSWLGWTFVGAIWALALGLILGTLWQEYQARLSDSFPGADDHDDDDDDDAPGMPGRYLIH